MFQLVIASLCFYLISQTIQSGCNLLLGINYKPSSFSFYSKITTNLKKDVVLRDTESSKPQDIRSHLRYMKMKPVLCGSRVQTFRITKGKGKHDTSVDHFLVLSALGNNLLRDM